MGKTYLIDTNVLLEYVAGLLPKKARIFVENVINEDFHISVINRIEVLGHESATNELADFLDLATTHQLTLDVEKQTIDLRKHKKTKLPDAIIAATALVHGFTIISRNTKDFQPVAGLACINPYDL
ncbi:type II toxin-antitoxin system VapC family toxin [Spirosoma spitsbergense]|uniref:type II toxin-antitoxin system VapC family toxin n=1 Tax=Spirosoma spitsbergense TaxID=431554 RepID=UPI00037EF0B4|nr:type II toxin-antitoxin system VapC family toxin [Spirosoma spitsbergense]